MTIAFLAMLENLPSENRVELIKQWEEDYQYKILFEELRDVHEHIDFHALVGMLKYYEISFSLGDNLFDKIEEMTKDTNIAKDMKYSKQRQTRPTVFTFMGLVKALKNCSSNYKKYCMLYVYFESCNRQELEWSIHCLINKKKVREMMK